MTGIGVVSSGAGFVSIRLDPPLEFIERQHGLFRDLLSDLTGLWLRFVSVMQVVEREQFESHGHGGWPPLADSTLREKAALGFPADPLVRTGALKDSLLDPARAVEIGVQSMSYGTDVAYAHYHQDPPVEGRPPRRPVIPDPLRVEDRRKLESATVSWLNQIAAEAFS